LKGAVILAERLRKNVEQLHIKVKNRNIRLTVSLGITVWEPGVGGTNKADIIDAADKALYKSKNTGRNMVSFVPASKSH
jgi:diguanylate cyclase (GGDEF)-like protein